MKANALTIDQRKAKRRAWRARTWAGVWAANGFSRGTIDALLRAEIDSNRLSFLKTLSATADS
jgi:hypothetical protein